MEQINFRIPEKNSPYTMKGTTTQIMDGWRNIPNEDTIIDKDGNQVEIRWFNGCPSIYVTEQEAKGFKRDRKYGVLDKMIMIQGMYVLDPKRDKTKVEYLMICNYNGSNPKRDTSKRILFEFVDKGKIAQVDFDNDLYVFTTKKLIHVDLKNDSDKLRKLYSLVLGDHTAFEDVEIKNQLLRTADKNKDINNPLSGAERILNAAKMLEEDTDDLVEDAERLGVIQVLADKVIYMGTDDKIIDYKLNTPNAKKRLIDFLKKPENEDKAKLIKKLVSEKRKEESARQVVVTS